jgi:thiol-disulfide isomerase/thioredoxin
MSKFAKYRVLILGLLSPVLALVAYGLVYNFLISISKNLEHDWLRRLSISTFAMTLPFFLVLYLFFKDRSRQVLRLGAKIGLLIAVLSLGLTAGPIRDGIKRWKQTRNMAMHGVPAPLFTALDIHGNPQSLAAQKGKVVLVNIWATWCGPCRAEMPNLDRLYRERQPQGFIVYGISDEDVATQQKFLQQIPVTYPLLTIQGNVPSLYRDIARYPALFLIDRGGNLQPAPASALSYEKIAASVDALLKSTS